MKRLLQSVLALLLFGAVLPGCVKTEVVDENPQEAMVRFDVELPDNSVPATRGIQTEAEAVVNSFYVLVFDKNDEFAYKKTIPASAFTSETSGAGSTAKEIKSFKVSLLKSSSAADLFTVVLLANVDASTALTTAVEAITVGDDRETVLEALTQTWTGNPAMPVPMASVPKAAVEVKETTSFSGANAFNMIRMVARIDVTLAASVATNYSVKRVLYYNYNTVGRVWTKNYSGIVTTGTTLPANPGTATAHTYYAVANTRSGGLADTHFTALLYAQEAAVNSATNRPCVVVELEDKTGVSVGHYRADLLSSSGSPKYLDILRNHRYQIGITNVYSNGFTDPDDAYNSTPVGLEATVVDWDEADMKDVIVNGNYWVSISSRDLILNNSAQTDTSVEITTNVSTGWSVIGVYDDANCSIAHGGAWLTSAAKSGNNLAVTVTQNSSVLRTAYVKLKAGTVEFTVKVTQKVSWIKIYASDAITEITSLDFPANNGTPDVNPLPQSFIVRWEPADQPLTITKTNLSGVDAAFSWQDASDALTTLPVGGSYTFTIDPVAISSTILGGNPSYNTGSKMKFTLDDGAGTTSEKSIDLTQKDYTFSATIESYYLLNGQSITIPLNSDSPWTATLGGNTGIIGGTLPTLSGAAGSGSLTFQLIADGSNALNPDRSFTITFSGLFGTKTVTIIGKTPYLKLAQNTYAVPGYLATSFDTGITSNIPVLTGLTANISNTGNGVLTTATLVGNSLRIAVADALVTAQTGTAGISIVSGTLTISDNINVSRLANPYTKVGNLWYTDIYRTWITEWTGNGTLWYATSLTCPSGSRIWKKAEYFYNGVDNMYYVAESSFGWQAAGIRGNMYAYYYGTTWMVNSSYVYVSNNQQMEYRCVLTE